MPFSLKWASETGKRFKRGPVKKEFVSIKEKLESFNEKGLNDLLVSP